MAYTALYRKWRPTILEDIRGQEHIVRTLQNQIMNNRIGHAYLFCGTRGTGKTSIAKIFAKAVNCENNTNGSPCGECQICKAIANAASMNVIEIDAASNNGVDNIRQIRDEVQYSPTEGNYRVYIIDEVHMLSQGAFNALLKTLEEPPSYVIFILATTEVHKIPITVLSRCQRYDFKRITTETIKNQLELLLKEERIETEEKALRYIAKVADGSMRDALSLTEQCVSFNFGEVITYDRVLSTLGAVDTSVFEDMLFNINEKNVIGCISIIEQIIMQGRELSQFVTDFIWHLRNLMLIKASNNVVDLLEVSEENFKSMSEIAALIEHETIVRYIRIFSELSSQMKYAANKRVLLEISIVKLCVPQMEIDVDSLKERILILEEKIENGEFKLISENTKNDNSNFDSNTKEGKPEDLSEPKQVVLPKAQLSDLTFIRSEWKNIVMNMAGSIGSIAPSFKETIVEPAGEGILKIVFTNNAHYTIGARDALLKLFEKYVADKYEKQIEFKASLRAANENNKVIYVSEDELKDNINMDIVVE
jgi:DNA polymerase III, subunit gamma and tau